MLVLSIAAPLRADDVGLEEIIARMDRLWAGRDRPGAMYDLMSLGAVAQAIDAESYEVQWRSSRAAFWVARTQSNRVVKKAMAVRATALAERAMALAPARAEGHYFYAVALGEYATSTGIIRAVREGLAGKIEAAALKAYALDRDFDAGAPMVVLGRFYFVLPWPMRDLVKSRRFLEELLQRHPSGLTGRYYLAETYHALGEDDAARRELELIIHDASAKATDDPEAPNVLAGSALREWFIE
jgi:hypothetical protein